ncbi:Na+/H+ antiporter subunit E, partial [Luteococcus sp.]
MGRGSLVDVQLHLHDDLRRTIIAEFTSLVPGTVVIDVHPETSIL